MNVFIKTNKSYRRISINLLFWKSISTLVKIFHFSYIIWLTYIYIKYMTRCKLIVPLSEFSNRKLKFLLIMPCSASIGESCNKISE